MGFSLTQATGQAIDAALWKIYRKLGGGELTQLAKLFADRNLLTELETILLTGSRPGMSDVTVQLAWIDKRPYALMDGEKSKVEIADAAVFMVETVVTNTTSYSNGHGLLLQAKAPSSADQLTAPKVCMKPAVPKKNSTTGRELRLMSKWPKFDLYLGSNSKLALASALKVPRIGKPPPMAWFIGTPFTAPRTLAPWPSPWMCAPAKQDHPCDETLGSLLARFFCGGQLYNTGTSKALVNAGAPFKYDPSDLTATHPACSDWDRLCLEIIRATRNQIIPPHLTHRPSTERLQTTTLHALPVGPALAYLKSWLVEGYHRLRRRGMPVLVVSRVMNETSPPCRLIRTTR